MTPTEYLTAEFLRYFPGAHIEVTFHDDGSCVEVEGEAIEVTVSADENSDPDYTFVMEIGSDDDCFRFDAGNYLLTIPFMQES